MKNDKSGRWLEFDAFRKNLHALAESRGLLYKDIAAGIDAFAPTISRYMSGKREPEIEYIYRLAVFFDVSMDYILGLTDDRHSRFPAESLHIADLYAMASDEDKAVVQMLLKKYEGKR